MKPYFFIAIGLIIINIGSGQNNQPRRPFHQIGLKDYSPIWYYTIVDSSFNNKEIRRNSTNFLVDNTMIPEVIDDNALYYCQFIENQGSYEGSYFGAIDINTGMTIWNNYFNLDVQKNLEFSQSMILSNEAIELIGLETETKLGSTLFPVSFFDSTCYLTTRRYDKHTGNIIADNHSDFGSPNTQKLSWAIREDFKENSKVFKIDNNKYKFVHHNKVKPDNTLFFGYIDENGRRIGAVDTLDLNKRYDSFYCYHLGNDNFLMIDNDVRTDYHTYNFLFYDENFNLIKSVSTKDSLHRSGFVMQCNIEDQFVSILTTTYQDIDTLRLSPEKLLWMIDFDGATLKKVKLEDDKGKSMINYTYTYDKSTQELIVATVVGQGLFDPPKSRFQFYLSPKKSDSLILTKELAVEDSIKLAFLERFTKLPNGNLVLLVNEIDVYKKNGRYDDFDINSNASSYICFDPKTLNLKSNTSNLYVKPIDISIFPNPTSNVVEIQKTNKESILMDIMDINGLKVLPTLKMINSEMRIDISSLVSGLYFCHFRDTNGNCLTRKVVKI